MNTSAAYLDRTWPEVLERHARHDPRRKFLRWMDSDRTLSYGEMLERVQACAGGLRDVGVGPGDTVIVMLPNGFEIVEAWFAINWLGAIEVPINAHLRGQSLAHVISDSQATVMVLHSDLAPLLADLGQCGDLRDIVVLGDAREARALVSIGYRVHPYEALHESPAVVERVCDDSDELMAILYTSGTTGPSKGIMYPYRQANFVASNHIAATEQTGDDLYFICMPLFHSNAQIVQLGSALLTGGQISIWPKFLAESWLASIRSVGATMTNTLGVMAANLAEIAPQIDDADNPLRVIQAIPAPADAAEALEERFGARCVDGYGLTDAGMVAYRMPGDELVPRASGRLVPGYSVRIADAATDRPVATGDVGEIQIRPEVPGAFMHGYWKNPEATVKAWRNLWFHTGDSGYVDDDGYLFFLDRIGDSIRVRGENVSSQDVEDVVLHDTQVAEAAAVAVPAERGDDEILLYVVPSPGVTIDPVKLLDSCRDHLPYYAIPRYVDIVDELPKTATGKIRKAALRSAGLRNAAWDRKAAGYRLLPDRRPAINNGAAE